MMIIRLARSSGDWLGTTNLVATIYCQFGSYHLPLPLAVTYRLFEAIKDA